MSILDDPKFIDGMFDAVMAGISKPEISHLISQEQKAAVLEALNVHIEEVSDTVVKMTYLFMIITVDMTNEGNPNISMSFDMNALLALIK